MKSNKLYLIFFLVITLSGTTWSATLQTLTLSIADTTLNKDHNTTLAIEAKYSDGSTKPVTSGIEWIATPSNAVTIHGDTLTALKDVNVTLQAKYRNKLSNPVKLNIYWEVDGHRLPPEPDPAVNNATLLGVDVNQNGVRDDVERKIYEKYHKRLHVALLMNNAKFYQLTLLRPTTEASETVKYSITSGNCELFLMDKDADIRSDNWRSNRENIKNITFNTKERTRKYLDYNLALSGGVYGSNLSDWNRDACSDEVKAILKEMGL